MNLNIELVGSNRERAFRGCPDGSATFTFTISDGPFKARAEVMLTNDGVEIIERAGKRAKVAARLALERLLVEGCDPFRTPIFLRAPYRQAELFSESGNFDQVSAFSKILWDLNDNSFDTTYGLSTAGAINLISGQTPALGKLLTQDACVPKLGNKKGVLTGLLIGPHPSTERTYR